MPLLAGEGGEGGLHQAKYGHTGHGEKPRCVQSMQLPGKVRSVRRSHRTHSCSLDCDRNSRAAMSRAECESCRRGKTVEWGELGLLTSNAGSFHRHAVPSLVRGEEEVGREGHVIGC